MDDAKLSTRLQEFGLSAKEVDTYLTILHHGEAKASVVAEDAGVSKRYVYSVSEELEKRGFVEVNDHAVPTMIRANPPGEVLGRLSTTLESLEPELDARYTSVARTLDEFDVIKARPTVIKRVRGLLARADEEVHLSVPASLVPEIEAELLALADRDLLSLLLLSGTDGSAVPDGLTDAASALRVWDEHAPTMLTVDGSHGLVAPNEMLAHPNSGSRAVTYAQQQLVSVLVGSFLGNYWVVGRELYRCEPTALPWEATSFRHAVLQATLHGERGTDLLAACTVVPVHDRSGEKTVEGRVLETRQSLLEPATSSFPVENTLLIETEDGEKAVGGEGAFVEDYRTTRVRLLDAD